MFGAIVQPSRPQQPSSYPAPADRCGSISLAVRKGFLGPRRRMHPHDFYSMGYDASQSKWLRIARAVEPGRLGELL